MIFNRLLQLSMVCLIFFATPGLSAKAMDEAQQLELLRQKIKKTRQSIRDMETKQHDLVKELESIDKRYSQTSGKLETLSQQSSQIEGELKRISSEKHRQQQNFSIKQGKLASQIRAAYRSGRDQNWRLFFSQSDPSRLARHMVYFRYLNQAQLEQIDQIKELLSTIASSEAKTVELQHQLSSQSEKIQSQQSNLADTRAQRSKLIQSLKTKINKEQKNLSELIQHEKQLQQLIEKISHSVKSLDLKIIDQRPFSKLKGRLIWPLDTFYSYKRRIINNRSKGLTIKTSEGTPVLAVAPGLIVFSDWMPGYGFLVIINHGSSYFTLYANNQRLIKTVGQRVKAADRIAYAGSSGGRSETALYFEIRRRKQVINPLAWLKKRRR
ncbi:MAG: peptidoglycan DD-metalloendopeptidase family protein [Gammaproteobacteria bacterium]|nr:peptidoglycan DD-metalloendopeptidase family protein [Gammaproteobacteria bacterium]